MLAHPTCSFAVMVMPSMIIPAHFWGHFNSHQFQVFWEVSFLTILNRRMPDGGAISVLSWGVEKIDLEEHPRPLTISSGWIWVFGGRWGESALCTHPLSHSQNKTFLNTQRTTLLRKQNAVSHPPSSSTSLPRSSSPSSNSSLSLKSPS